MDPIKVFIADDHPLMRDAIAAAVEDEPDMIVVGTASNGFEAVEFVRSAAPDLIIMDVYMPGKDGLQAIREIKAENPQVRILALTSSSDESTVLSAVEAGALGYILKDASRTNLLNAIRMVAQGEVFLPPNILLKFVNRLHQENRRDKDSVQKGQPTVADPLTEREREVLNQLGQGLTNREIAQALFVSEATVRAHIFHILRKLNLGHRNQAVVYAARKE
jgi:DNA-binding NarL/FixJ family response regulator